MLKNFFNPQPDQRPSQSQVEQALAQIGLAVPEAHWLAVVTSEGLLCGAFRMSSEHQADRIVAMSVALFALGERIANELQDGRLQFNLLMGAEAATLVLVLSPAYLLTLGLNRTAAMPAVFANLRAALAPLYQTLQLETLIWLEDTNT